MRMQQTLLSMNKTRPTCAPGVTVIELLVVIAITLVLAVSISLAVKQALSFHQQGREEAFVRQSLTAVLERLAGALEMAKSVTEVDPGRWRAEYRMETGGVSFETNRFVHVSGTVYGATNLNALLSIRHAGTETDLHMTGNATLDAFLAQIDSVHIRGSGSLREVEVAARHRVKTRDGSTTNLIVVSRPVRLWNSH